VDVQSTQTTPVIRNHLTYQVIENGS